MKFNKTTLSLVGIFLLIAGIVFYHFIAANQAEKDIQQSISQLGSEDGIFFSISASKVNIRPFKGDISVENINAINEDYTLNIGSVFLDLSYLDIVNIYFNGPEYGLRQAESGLINTYSVSMVWRPLFLQAKVDTLLLTYSGPVLGIMPNRSDNNSHLEILSQIKVYGDNFTVTQPNSKFGKIQADSVYLTKYMTTDSDSMNIKMDSLFLRDINWTPPANLLERFEFFIKGFGYTSGDIPIESIFLRYRPTIRPDSFTVSQLTVVNELLTANARGQITLNYSDLSTSRLENMEIRITDISEKLDNLMGNFEQLFNITLPRRGDDIQFYLSGPIQKPVLIHNIE